MKRLPVAALAFAGALFISACDDQPTSPRSGLLPRAAISDAANGGGNSAIYFLPPVTDQPNIVGQFNPNLTRAVIRICKMVDFACTQVVASFGAGQSTGPIVISSNHYLAAWHVASSSPAVIVGAEYRIEVFPDDPGSDLSAVPEAWADVQAVNSGKEFRNLRTNDIVPLLPNGSLPIKVWIGSNVRCESTNCTSKVVDNGGSTLVLGSGNGALLLQDGWLPPGVSNVTVTLQRHAPGPNNDCVGKAAFTPPGLVAQREACLQVTTDPVIVPGPTTGIQKAAFVYLCTESDEGDPFHEFLQIIKADDGQPLEALKDVSHADLLALGFVPGCEGTSDIGMISNPILRLAARGLNAITRPVARLLEVEPLYAIDLGQGGEIGRFAGFSYFTLGAVAELEKIGETPETAEAGTSQSLDVRVTSLTHHPPGEAESESLEGVSVRFMVTDGNGGLFDPEGDGESDPVDEVTVQTGSGEGAGFANVHLLVAEGTNVVEAVVIANGVPASAPVTFSITGTDGEGFSISTLQTGLAYPKGLWVTDEHVYVTEAAGRMTAFGGRERLFRTDLNGSNLEVLLGEPSNVHAVVVANDGKVYLTSGGSTTDDEGNVSVVEFFAGEGWQENSLLDLATSSRDMFIADNQDIYVLGASDNSGANSLYRLPAGNYVGGATVLETGLGRTWAITGIASTIYYAAPAQQEVRRFTEGNELYMEGVSVFSLTSDGIYLYYAEVNFGDGSTQSFIKRKHLDTGVIETLATLDVDVTAVRYNPANGNLYFLEGGTADAEYTNGALKMITGVGSPPVP